MMWGLGPLVEDVVVPRVSCAVVVTPGPFLSEGGVADGSRAALQIKYSSLKINKLNTSNHKNVLFVIFHASVTGTLLLKQSQSRLGKMITLYTTRHASIYSQGT